MNKQVNKKEKKRKNGNSGPREKPLSLQRVQGVKAWPRRRPRGRPRRARYSCTAHRARSPQPTPLLPVSTRIRPLVLVSSFLVLFSLSISGCISSGRRARRTLRVDVGEAHERRVARQRRRRHGHHRRRRPPCRHHRCGGWAKCDDNRNVVLLPTLVTETWSSCPHFRISRGAVNGINMGACISQVCVHVGVGVCVCVCVCVCL